MIKKANMGEKHMKAVQIKSQSSRPSGYQLPTSEARWALENKKLPAWTPASSTMALLLWKIHMRSPGEIEGGLLCL